MRSQLRTLAFVSICIVGCKDNDFEIDPNYVPTFLADNCPKYQADGGTPPDLAIPPPKCAAAKGLAGEALICVDADKSTLADLRTQGWTGFKDGTGTDCWEIASVKLQVKNFGTFVGTCSFTMPLTDLAAAANQKYQSVTLAVVQRVDLNASALPPQSAKSMLGLDDPSRLLTTTTDKTPRQQQVYTLTRSDLAGVPGVGTNFQPLFKLSSAAVAPGNTGWQIESIAVMGNP